MIVDNFSRAIYSERLYIIYCANEIIVLEIIVLINSYVIDSCQLHTFNKSYFCQEIFFDIISDSTVLRAIAIHIHA